MRFEDFCRGLGLRPRLIAADGKWRRCPTEAHPKKKNGAYKLAPGGGIGWAQDWATMENPAQWTASTDEVPEYDPAVVRKAWEKREAERARAIQAATVYYREAKPLRDGHPYLHAHGLDMTGTQGLRVDSDGWLIIPAYREKRLVSIQRIAPDGTKRFWPGAPVAGSAWRIERRTATLSILCEGVATGMALYAALPDSRVIVAWSTGNLSADHGVPKGWRVIAADNDHGTEARTASNPGIEAAQKAAQALSCGVAYPEGIQGTDWADARQEWAEIAESKGHRSPIREADARIRGLVMAQARYVP